MVAGTCFVYVGTYSVRGSEGIYQYEIDLSSGRLTLMDAFHCAENPTFLAIDTNGRHLYAVSEVADPHGAVSAFSIDSQTGRLNYLNKQLVRGGSPCHLSVDATGSFVLGANYDGGSVFVLQVVDDGSLGQVTDFVQHEGSSINPERQRAPHTHSITMDPSNRYAFAADLGTDKIMTYEFDADSGTLSANKQPWVTIQAGAGPRHFTFHPEGRYAYLINELDSTIVSLVYDQASGTLRDNGTVSALPAHADLQSKKDCVNWCADIHVSPSGTRLYGSNRGHDSITVFDIDADNGKLSYMGYEPSGGETPRGFAIDPTGSLLLAANQDTDTVVAFYIDQDTGALTPTGHVAEVPSPVCMKFINLL